MNCLGFGTLLWVKLELVVRLRVPERRDSIFTRVTQGFDWALGTGDHFHAVFSPYVGDWIRLEMMDEATTVGKDKYALQPFVFMKRDKRLDCIGLTDLFEITNIKHAILVHCENKNSPQPLFLVWTLKLLGVEVLPVVVYLSNVDIFSRA